MLLGSKESFGGNHGTVSLYSLRTALDTEFWCAPGMPLPSGKRLLQYPLRMQYLQVKHGNGLLKAQQQFRFKRHLGKRVAMVRLAQLASAFPYRFLFATCLFKCVSLCGLRSAQSWGDAVSHSTPMVQPSSSCGSSNYQVPGRW